MTQTEALAQHLTMLAADPAAMLAATRDRMGGSRCATLRVFLHTYAGGRCVSCGQATRLDASRSAADYAEVGHLIAASTYAPSNVRAGFVPGNVGNMCHTCNADASAADHSFTADEVDASLIPLVWPVLKSQTMGESDYATRARQARKW